VTDPTAATPSPAGDASVTPEAAAVATPADAPAKKSSRTVKVLGAIGGVVVAALVAFGVRAGLSALSGPSKQEIIEKGVEQALEMFDLPQQIDQVTIFTAITAESDAIRYDYTLVDVDPAAVTEEVLTGIVLPGLCSTKETREILDHDIAMKYIYLVESTGESYALTFTQADC